MEGDSDEASAAGVVALLDDGLPAPSSLISSRWTRDNLITSHPGRLYDGEIVERIDADALEQLFALKGINAEKAGYPDLGGPPWQARILQLADDARDSAEANKP
jgi:hypothetical protein